MRSPRFATAAVLAIGLALAGAVAVPRPSAAQPAQPAQRAAHAHPAAAAACPWVDSTAPIKQRVAMVLARMTLDDKIGMVHGVPGSGYAGSVAANPQLCIPALKLQDGPAGVGDGLTGVTQLPAPVAGAASWDPAIMRSYGKVLGSEEWGKGANVTLAPTVNIDRDPRWGRSFESLSEDPYLNGQLGVADIEGIQSQGEIAQVKHWAVYNQETNRNTPQDNAVIDERTLHEIYSPQFEAAVKQARVGSVMCSYSTINGTNACENPYLLTDTLKQGWHFPGFVTSDWGGTHSSAPAANAGLDMQMPDDSQFGAPLKAAVQSGAVPMSRLDDMLSRILTEMFRFKLFTRTQTGTVNSVVTSAKHAATARQVAEAGTVLLKNSRANLPLSTKPSTGKMRSIAVIGDDAGTGAQSAGGGSAAVVPPYVVTPYDGIKNRAGNGVSVKYAPGPSPTGALPAVPASAFGSGLQANFYNGTALSGGSIASRTDPNVDFDWKDGSPASGVPAEEWSAAWTGTLTPPTTGTYTFSLTSDDGSRLSVDGKQLIDNWRDQPTTTETATISLTANKPVSVAVEYYQGGGDSNLSLGWQPPGGPSPIAQAVALAKKSDVAVVFASYFESEGSDLTSIDLPGQQNQLISAVARVNPRTVVVLNTGSAVTMPWVNKVRSVVEAWYPGQEDGNAIASVLFGDVDPGGKLPISFPKRLAQVPAHTPQQWPGVDGNVQYSEKLQVGYRWYDAQHIAPLYPFGYGLSYTSFRLHGLTVGPTSINSRHPVTVTAYLTNTGSRAGSDTAQLYVGDPAAIGEPPRQLHGFQKVFLRPGETRQVRFRLDPMEAFGYWNTAAHGTAVADGAYRIMVGDSSTHLPLHATVHVTRTFGPQTVTVDAPATIASGGSGTVTTTFTNDADVPVRQARVSLTAPTGWSTKALSTNRFPLVRPGQAVVTHWLVQVPADAAGTQTLTATARFTEQGRRGTASSSATVTVPYPSVAAAYNTVGVSPDADPTVGNLDGGGYSFSAEALHSAGVDPGQPVPNDGGAGFVWPDVAAGQPDAVTAAGQTITLTGAGSTLSVLGCGTFGTQTVPVTLTYSDGSTSTGSIVLSDWYANAADPGDQLVVTTPHWNVPLGSTLDPDHDVSLYASSVALSPGKTLASITLPSNANAHIFAVTVH